uniref:Beta-defensin n=1 Tax=Bos indicus x Bos taurus TaxID=30522 RepID=A0A4W2C1T9_BOBOX
MNSGSFSYTCLIYLFLFHLPFLYRESKKENLECEKMGGACKYQNTHGSVILPGECKSRKKHCCRV